MYCIPRTEFGVLCNIYQHTEVKLFSSQSAKKIGNFCHLRLPLRVLSHLPGPNPSLIAPHDAGEGRKMLVLLLYYGF